MKTFRGVHCATIGAALFIMWLLATLYCVATSPVDGWRMMREEMQEPGCTQVGGTAALVMAACGGGMVGIMITVLAGMR